MKNGARQYRPRAASWRTGCLLGRRHVAHGRVGAVAEEVLFHLRGQVFAGALVGQVQAVFVDQHGLVLEPRGPRLFRDLLVNLLAEFARYGGKSSPSASLFSLMQWIVRAIGCS